MKPGSKVNNRRHIEAISAKGDSAYMADLQPRHIEADLGPLTPAVAKSRLTAWRHLCPFWKSKGWIDTDVSAPVKRKKMPKTAGHKEWTHDDLDAFRKHWPIGTPQRLACELLQWTGARASDAVLLGRQMVRRDGLLHFTQEKTGNPAHVPWTAPAWGLERQREDLMKCLQPDQAMFILTVYGKPRSRKSFSSWFSAACTTAKLPDLSAHGLRKYRMNTLAESGVSLLGMQGWVGHVTLEEVQLYTERANKRQAVQGAQSVNPASPTVNSEAKVMK
ncbi:tyrosine-type recombinase/integrase [Yoonia sp. R2331]|uniref:tyrosine-type recombinase/integrase n=1 Tax=Yoonia sp. R2331 TaxID=3237238 RepID=UPI0034E46CCA